jgi:hypothetical protein
MTNRIIGLAFLVGVAAFVAAAAYELIGREPSPLAQGAMIGAIGILLIGAGLRNLKLQWISMGGVAITKEKHPLLFRFYVILLNFVGAVVMIALGIWTALR